MAKQKQIKMQQMQVGALAAIQQLEHRTDEQLQGESKHKVAAKALLGARAAERYDAKAARAYFNEAMAGCHPQERPALQRMMKASLALAERRPDDLKAAVEKLGQEAPSGRQLFLLRMMGLIAPPPGRQPRDPGPRHPVLVVALIVLLVAVGFGLATLVLLPFGGGGILRHAAGRPADRGRRARRAHPVRQTAPGADEGRTARPGAGLASFSLEVAFSITTVCSGRALSPALGIAERVDLHRHVHALHDLAEQRVLGRQAGVLRR